MKINRTKLYRAIQWIVLVAAYLFLGYKLYSYDGYSDWFNYFRTADAKRFLWLLPSLVLIPLNIFFEACKWHALVAEIFPVSLWDAVRQVYYGQLTAFVTPYKAGDYPGRIAMMLSDKENSATLWSQLLGIGMLNSTLILVVIMALGLPFVGGRWFHINPMYMLIAIVIALAMLPLFTKKLRPIQLFAGLFYSLVRYCVWMVQLACVLVVCGIDLTYAQLLSALPCYYFFVSIAPSMPAADPAVRGSFLLFVLSDYTDATASVALAAVLIWVLNTLVPTFLGSLLRFSKGKTE